jgi:nucleoside 2-deoxyribosyltransferase
LGFCFPGRGKSRYVMAMPKPLRIYLAGPEVFLPDAVAMGQEKVRLAAEAGFEGVYPLDASLDLTGLDPFEQARRIALANEGLIASCDALIANLTPFRGASMDAGTAFEVGFMRALGRPVLGYSNISMPYAARARHVRALGPFPGDADGPNVAVEDFGLAENLMLEIAITESGFEVIRQDVPPGQGMRDLTGYRRCLAALRAHLERLA